MPEWCEVTRRQRRYAKKSQGWRAQSRQRAPEWQCGMQDAIVPQQGRMPRLQKAEGRGARRVHQRVGAECGLATAGRRILRSPSTPYEQAERSSPSSCISSAAADAGKSVGDARRMRPTWRKQGAVGGDCDETGSTLGTEDGPSASQISSCLPIGRKSD